MNKKMLVAVSVLGIAGITGLSTYALAYQGDYAKTGPNCSTEQKSAVESAINSNDYNKWKNLMQGKGRVIEVINESNFPKFSEAYKLGKEGKIAEADAIRVELGLRTSTEFRSGQGKGQGFGRGEHKNWQNQ